MLVSRTFDPEPINKICNHPDVLPWVTLGTGKQLDCTGLVENDANWCFIGDGMVFIARWVSAGTYEVHTMAIPASRGRKAVRGALQAIDEIFNNGAALLFGWTPVDNLAANAFNRLVGFKKRFTAKVEQVPRMTAQRMNYWEKINGN